MPTPDDNVRPEEVEASEEKNEAKETPYAEEPTPEPEGIDKPAEEDDPNAGKGDETPQSKDDAAEDESPVEKASEAPFEEEKADEEPVEAPAETEPIDENDAPEEKTNALGDPLPEEDEEHEVFCNRYMNHPNVLRRITPSYRRAAAESTWKEYKNNA
jgi:hypothetical protein